MKWGQLFPPWEQRRGEAEQGGRSELQVGPARPLHGPSPAPAARPLGRCRGEQDRVCESLRNN